MDAPRPISRPALAGALLTATSGALPLMLAGTLVVLVTEDLGISEAAFGLAISAFFGTSAVLSARSGRLADRIGWRPAMVIASAVSMLSLVALATLATTYAAFVACIALGGVAGSLAMPASNLALVRVMPAHRQGLVFGIKQTSNPVAGLIAGVAIPVVALTLGWRWAFGAAAIVPLAALATVLRMDDVAEEPVESRPTGSVGALDMGPLVVLGLGGFLASFAVISLSSFVVASAVESGVTVGVAGVYVAISSIVGLLGRVIGGWMADRWGSRGLRPAAVLLAVGTLGPLGLALGSRDLVLPAMILTYASAWGWPGLFQYGVTAHHRHAPASATGIAMIGVLVGGALGPVSVGLMIPLIGYGGAWSVVAGFVAAGAVCLLWAATMLEGRLDRGGDTPAGSGREPPRLGQPAPCVTGRAGSVRGRSTGTPRSR